MSIPKFDELFQITLDAIRKSGGTATIYAIEDIVAENLNLTDEEQKQIHNEKEGKRTELGYRLAWARNYLKNAGFIENIQRTVWSLTPKGKQILVVDKDQIINSASENDIAKLVKQSEIEFDIFNDEVEAEDESSETTIVEPFDPKKVDIVPKSMILEAIFKRLKNNEIDLLTGFQRKGGLWDKTKQSRLIESLLIRFPLPAFYFDGTNDNKWLIVDGLQRISTLKSFVLDETLELENLEFLDKFNGCTFSMLPRDLQRRIEEFEITVYIINPGTPDKVKYNVFKRINTGGLVLSSQEIRHALNQGKPANFVKRLANCEEFKIATTYSISSDRMLDRDFANRFIAFYLSSVDEYKPDLDSFLNESLGKLKQIDDLELDEIYLNFKKSMCAAKNIFDIHAFRKRFSLDEKRKPINKALFEVWSVLLAKLNDEDLSELQKKKDVLNDNFIQLMIMDDQFNRSISSGTGGTTQVKKRFKEIKGLIEKTLAS